jgi:hypothetical protein
MLSILQFIKNLKELNIRIFIRKLRRIHDKRCNKKIEVTRYEDHIQEINPKQSVLALIPIEKLNGLLILTSVCEQCATKY